MKLNFTLLFIVLPLLFLACTAHAQTTSASNSFVAQPIPHRSILYKYNDAGVSKAINWGLDCAWANEGNMRRGIAFMGPANVDLVRASFQPTHPLVNGDLQTQQVNDLNYRLYLLSLTGPNTAVVLNCDHPTVDPWYIGNPLRWAQLIDVTTKRFQEAGRTVLSVAPFNEPDFATAQYGGGNGMLEFYNICGELKNMSRFNSIRISGGNTLNCDQALPWYNYLRSRLNEGNTHQLAGNFDNYASFYQTVKLAGHHATNDELHNMMEAMVGVEYGMQTGIWWGTCDLARGEFVKASDGKRLGYAEHRPNWSAASVYRAPDGKVQAFGGTSERQAATTTYRFVSKEQDVFYDGYGPQREYTMVLPGGTGYQQGQVNAERMVNITMGEDIQPVINGRYVIVNRNSGKVLEVSGASLNDGANVQQSTKTGANNQQWDVTPVSITRGGDYSYFDIRPVHSGQALDVYGFSLDNGGNLTQWSVNEATYQGVNQQWYLDYAEDGWFYIRSRLSAKCVDVFGASMEDGGNVCQWEKNGGLNQQWRLIPIDAAIEFNAPSAPVNLVATGQLESIRLDWTAGTEPDIAGYDIFKSDNAAGPWVTIARKVTSNSFVDNTTTLGGDFFYKIKAVDKSLNRSAYSNSANAIPTGLPALVQYLPFNGNRFDSSVNLNHAALFGGTYSEGKVGSGSINLNGSTAFVQLPATVANQQAMTVAAWIYWNGGSEWQRIFDFGNSESEYMFLTPKSGNNTLRFAIANNGGEQQLNATTLSSGVWSHVAVTIGASGATMYVNGQQVAQSVGITVKPSDFKPVLNYIGRSQFNDALLNGAVDEFRIYNYAMTGDEVLALSNGVLPLTWGDFTAERKGESAQLNWVTIQENNVAKFYIERSNDGKQFESIGESKAAGNSIQSHKYTFTDQKPLKGTNFYRIRQVDFDGKSSLSVVRTLSFEITPSLIIVSPNPAKDFITIHVPDNQKLLQATLFSITGQKVAAFSMKGETGILNLGALQSGVYHLHMTGDGVNFSSRILVNK